MGKFTQWVSTLFKKKEVIKEQVSMDNPVEGIDVSCWQRNIRWDAVKNSGIKFAMIRLGFGSPDGSTITLDNTFKKNVQGALKAGLDVGCYFYSYAKSVDAAGREADKVVKVLKDFPATFKYPIAFDIEDPSQSSLGRKTLTGMATRFCEKLEAAKYYCSIYTNLNWFVNKMDDTKLRRYDHWLAQWSSCPTYNGAIGMWQYTSGGAVPGIDGRVDLDSAFYDYPKIIVDAKLNGFGEIKPEPPKPDPVPDTKFEVGEKADFIGTKQYASSSAAAGTTAHAGLVKVTIVSKGAKHPYHCRSIDKNGNYIYGVYGWVNEKDMRKVGDKPKPPKPPVKVEVETGDIVAITGSKYYDGTLIPKWVKNKNWYVHYAKKGNNRVVIDESSDHLNFIMSPVHRKDLKVIKKH